MRLWYKNIELLWDSCPKAYKDIEDEYGTLRIQRIPQGFLLSRKISFGKPETFTAPITVRQILPIRPRILERLRS